MAELGLVEPDGLALGFETSLPGQEVIHGDQIALSHEVDELLAGQVESFSDRSVRVPSVEDQEHELLGPLGAEGFALLRV